MNVIRIIMAAVISIAISGCDNPMESSSIKKAIRAELKDPDSAKFDDQIIVQTRACISVNAKNSYGGYTGSTIAHLEKIETGKWLVDTLDGEPCNKFVLKRKLEIDKANNEAEKSIIKKLKAKNFLSASYQHISMIDDKQCEEFVWELMTTIRLANETSDKAEKKSLQADADRKIALIDSGTCK